MALIKCPNCGREMSDRAAKCPQCGMSIEDVKAAMQQSANENAASRIAEEFRQRPALQESGINLAASTPQKRKPMPIWVYVVVGLLVAAIFAVVFWPENDGDDPLQTEVKVGTDTNNIYIISLDGEWCMKNNESVHILLTDNMEYKITEEEWCEYGITDEYDNLIDIRDTFYMEVKEKGSYKIFGNDIVLTPSRGRISRGTVNENGEDVTIELKGSGEEGDMDAIYVPSSKIKINKNR